MQGKAERQNGVGLVENHCEDQPTADSSASVFSERDSRGVLAEPHQLQSYYLVLTISFLGVKHWSLVHSPAQPKDIWGKSTARRGICAVHQPNAVFQS
jgi:hypothetical protein